MSHVYKLAGGRALGQEVGVAAVHDDKVNVTRGVSGGVLLIADQPNLLKSGSRARFGCSMTDKSSEVKCSDGLAAKFFADEPCPW